MQEQVSTGIAAEIVEPRKCEQQVAAPQCGGRSGIGLPALLADRGELRTKHGGDTEHKQQRWQQATEASRIETCELEAASAGQFIGQEPGDQIAGQDEKHIHADEATGQPWHAGMGGDHKQDGDGTEAFDIRAKGQGVSPGGVCGHQIP